MSRFWCVVLFLLSSTPAFAKLPVATDFTTFTINDEALGTIRLHIDKVDDQSPGPLVVWLPGSGATPYFQHFTDGSVGFSVPPALLAYRDRAHFLLVDKPGVPFEATLKFDEKRGRPVELDNPIYHAGITKDYLVARTALAVEQARKLLGSRITNVVVIGGSEGSQYAFALASRVRADEVVVWGGIALPQYFDFVIEQRLAAERGEITRVQAQENVEKLFAQIRDIQAHPSDLGKRFDGDPYRRWSSFGPYAAVDDMLKLDMPLLVVQGGADRNSPILNIDFAMIAFLSHGKTNLDYWVYPELDHFFRLSGGSKATGPAPSESEVWSRIWDWIEQHRPKNLTTTSAR